MHQQTFTATAVDAPIAERSAFLRRAALWTLAGLTMTAVTSLLSIVVIVPVVLQGGTLAIIGVVYGSFLLSQTVARRMVYGTAKPVGFVLGTAAQGIALSFLLLFTVAAGGGDGLMVIGYALAMTLTSVVGMLAYVSMEKRDFSMLRAGLAMMFVPMLVLMGLQLVFPIGGTMGIVISLVFVAVSVGAMLWTLNKVLYAMPLTMGVEAGYEISLAIVVLFWNVLALLNRIRR